MAKRGKVDSKSQGTTTKSDLTVRDVPSKGLSTRVDGVNPSEMHHVFSILERRYFYVLKWSRSIHDIKSQQLLPLEDTQEIASRLGVKHPEQRKTHEPYQMSTDFVIEVMEDGVKQLKARSVKPEAELNKRRTIEKLEIERVYWYEKGIDWGIVTEHEIPLVLAENVEWVLKALHFAPGVPILEDQLFQVADALLQEIQTSDGSFSSAALATDDRLGLSPGAGLWVAKHMIANRKWEVDMNERLDPSKKLEILSIYHHQQSGGEYA